MTAKKPESERMVPFGIALAQDDIDLLDKARGNESRAAYVRSLLQEHLTTLCHKDTNNGG